jgi:hypothetical protein
MFIFIKGTKTAGGLFDSTVAKYPTFIARERFKFDVNGRKYNLFELNANRDCISLYNLSFLAGKRSK